MTLRRLNSVCKVSRNGALWAAVAVSLCAGAGVAQEEEGVAGFPENYAEIFAVPSGQDVVLYESFIEDAYMGPTLRLRFLDEALPKRVHDLSYADLEADLAHLCATVGLPQMDVAEPTPDLVVVSVAAAPTEFGFPDPKIVEVFEAYRVHTGTCEWEAF